MEINEIQKSPLEQGAKIKKCQFLFVYINKYTKCLVVWFLVAFFALSNNSFGVMQIISTREFRANQKKYFDLAESETILVARKNARPIVIRVADDDDFLSKAELQSIQKGVEDIRNGRTYKMQQGESLADFLKRNEAYMK